MMPPDGTILREPTSAATETIVQICATGMPASSISLPITAPQRVLDPQVEVRMTPSTPAACKLAAMP